MHIRGTKPIFVFVQLKQVRRPKGHRIEPERGENWAYREDSEARNAVR